MAPLLSCMNTYIMYLYYQPPWHGDDISRESRHQTPEKTNQIKVLKISNFQKEKPTICTTTLTLGYIIVEKRSSHAPTTPTTRPTGLKDVFHLELLLLLLLAPCALASVRLSLQHISFIPRVVSCCEKECEIGSYQATTQVSSNLPRLASLFEPSLLSSQSSSSFSSPLPPPHHPALLVVLLLNY
jgi:hypothetical protein